MIILRKVKNFINEKSKSNKESNKNVKKVKKKIMRKKIKYCLYKMNLFNIFIKIK